MSAQFRTFFQTIPSSKSPQPRCPQATAAITPNHPRAKVERFFSAALKRRNGPHSAFHSLSHWERAPSLRHSSLPRSVIPQPALSAAFYRPTTAASRTLYTYCPLHANLRNHPAPQPSPHHHLPPSPAAPIFFRPLGRNGLAWSIRDIPCATLVPILAAAFNGDSNRLVDPVSGVCCVAHGFSKAPVGQQR